MDKGYEQVRQLGPVLGAYHPVVAYNVARLREISASTRCPSTCPAPKPSCRRCGSRAITRGARSCSLLRRLSRLVGRCAAGHRQPVPARETYTLADMSEATLRVLRTRTDIACVLVNPCQAMHPNAGPPADSALVDSGRAAHFDKEAYGAWLRAAPLRLQRARHRAHLRRGLPRLPTRARRRAGIFRRASRPRHLWQDVGWRACRSGLCAVAESS